MKIGYYIRYFPYKNRSLLHPVLYAGPEVVAYNLALNMAKRGHEVKIFTISVDRRDSVEKYENITIYRYAKSFSVGYFNISFGLFYKPLKHQVDIVHAHSSGIAGFTAIQYARRKHIPFVLTHHGELSVESLDNFIQRMCASFYKNHLMEKVLSYPNVIISPSEYFINESRFLGKYRDKVIVIPNGVNIEDFDIPYSKEECREKLKLSLNKNLILFVGNLASRKGLDILVKAMPKIIKKNPDTELVFVGSGWMKEKLERLSKKIGVEKSVEFAGFIKENLKPLYYKAADIFVLPSTSTSESFGIVNLEAMACGVSIVASRIGGVPNVVKNGQNGLLVPPGDSEALTDAIIYLLENEDVREKMGRNGRKKVEDYSWDKIAEKTEKVYEIVIEQ